MPEFVEIFGADGKSTIRRTLVAIKGLRDDLRKALDDGVYKYLFASLVVEINRMILVEPSPAESLKIRIEALKIYRSNNRTFSRASVRKFNCRNFV